MLSVYIVCLLGGGIVLGASLLGGHDGDVGGDAHADGDLLFGSGLHASHDLHSDHAWLGRLPFLSFRFWTWAVTFFGLTGLVLHLVGTPSHVALSLALVAGVATGWGASYVLARLARNTVGILPDASAHIGCEGRLLLPLKQGGRSKVRLRVGGADVDLVAESDSPEALPTGSPVWVVGLRGTHVVVEASPLGTNGSTESSETDKEKP